ncbi:ADP-ribosylglycohydrolase family protein [Bacillus vallismortis]|uniref:ADP-ribosylglycohydrolase family protein n=1 Tax=Bacillus vallismortis TaxID=72361 RepID=UPI003B97DC65
MKNILKVEFEDKYLGAFLGAVVGDAIGWPQEDRSMRIGKNFKPKPQFQKWYRRSGNKYLPHEEVIDPGSYSDDTQLLIATARSLENKNWFSHFVKVELPTWLLYERGGGGATKRAADLWSNGHPPWKLEKQKKADIKRYFEAGGNGVTMRILPHVFNSFANPSEISHQVFLNGIATHGHPKALLSAILYSKALEYQIKKEDVLAYGELIEYLLKERDEWSNFPDLNNLEDWKESANFFTSGNYMKIWEETSVELIEGLYIIKNALNQGLMDKTHQTLTRLNCFDSKIRGAGTVACLVAIYIASKYASDPVRGLLEISFLENTDSDTNASMVGGLLGSIHGTEWIIPEWYEVQDYDYLCKLVQNLKKEKSNNNPTLWHWSEKNKFKRLLPSIGIGDKLILNTFGEIELVKKINHKPLTKNIEPVTYKFLSSQGQSLYIKLVNKIEKNNIHTKIVPVKNNKRIVFEEDDLEKLIDLIPPRITAKKTFSIILDLIQNIDNLDTKNESEIKAYASKFIRKGYELDLIVNLIKGIKEKRN